MDEAEEWQRKRAKTIRDTIQLLEEIFGDTEYLAVSMHPKLPDEILYRLHRQIRAATAGGGVRLELRTWISEFQIATGDQGVSWVKDWPEEDERIRHVQLIEFRHEEEPVVHWSTPSLEFGD